MSRFQLGAVFISLLVLRLAVGFHFFKEGTNKLKSGKFTAQGFFANANGPLAPHFKDMLDDPDGQTRLCVTEFQNDAGETQVKLDPEFTFLVWDKFIDDAWEYYGFGSPELEEKLIQRREDLAKKIQTARTNNDSDVDTEELEQQRWDDEQSILKIRKQPELAEEILENHKLLLADFLDSSETELVAHFSTSDRLSGFEKDGPSAQDVAVYVDSLRGQVDTIRSDRRKKLAEWTKEVDDMWDSLEDQINSLAVDAQANRPRYPIHKPFNQENSTLKIIDAVIPWFDTTIGVLLIIGLFSRLASGAAAVFLAGVIATQPPWIPGSDPSYYQCIELAACLVLFATVAGRFGGLDYFLQRKPKPQKSSNATTETRSQPAA